jgi:hypothetical protein
MRCASYGVAMFLRHGRKKRCGPVTVSRFADFAKKKKPDFLIHFPASGDADTQRALHHRAGTRPGVALDCRRGDRIVPTAAQNVRLWHKADISVVISDVCFWG